jgi:biopolymer transport protein ExbD
VFETQLKKQAPEADINLIPIMNLFVALIPFLLMSAAFFQLSIVNASVPTVAEDDTIIGVDRIKVNMTVQVKPSGLKLTGGNEALTVQEMRRLRRWLPKTKGEYPYKRFSRFLLKVKKRYRRSDTLILIPDDNNSFDEIVQLMDAARNYEEKGIEVDLFTNVVLSSKVK